MLHFEDFFVHGRLSSSCTTYYCCVTNASVFASAPGTWHVSPPLCLWPLLSAPFFPPSTQSPSCVCRSTTAAAQQAALSMLAAAAACGWSKVARRRRRRRRRRKGVESGQRRGSHTGAAHSTERLLQLAEQGLHEKVCHWQHRWSVKGGYWGLEGWILITKEEKIWDKVKKMRRSAWWDEVMVKRGNKCWSSGEVAS